VGPDGRCAGPGTVVFQDKEDAPVQQNPALHVVFIGGVVLICAICILSIAYRLQKHAAQRVDAERRASAALEEMNRATKELRARHGNDPADDPSLTPGERLQRMYPGVPRPATAAGSEDS
jgi:cytochrome c-type biogenesis protein CcmH/NrfG